VYGPFTSEPSLAGKESMYNKRTKGFNAKKVQTNNKLIKKNQHRETKKDSFVNII